MRNDRYFPIVVLDDNEGCWSKHEMITIMIIGKESNNEKSRLHGSGMHAKRIILSRPQMRKTERRQSALLCTYG